MLDNIEPFVVGQKLISYGFGNKCEITKTLVFPNNPESIYWYKVSDRTDLYSHKMILVLFKCLDEGVCNDY